MWRNMKARFFYKAAIFWKYRHLWDGRWGAGYSNNQALYHKHRKFILEAMAKYAPYCDLNVLELGCGAGANLKRIQIRWPWAQVTGIDVSQEAVNEVKSLEWEDGPATFKCQDIREGKWRNDRYDIILTDAMLISLRPETLRKVLAYCLEAASMALVFCEWHHYGSGGFIDENHWVHNYLEFFPKAVITKIPPELWPGGGGWEKYGSIIEVDLR